MATTTVNNDTASTVTRLPNRLSKENMYWLIGAIVVFFLILTYAWGPVRMRNDARDAGVVTPPATNQPQVNPPSVIDTRGAAIPMEITPDLNPSSHPQELNSAPGATFNDGTMNNSVPNSQ